MKILVVIAFAAAAGGFVREPETHKFTCREGSFAVTMSFDQSKGGQWADNIVLRLQGRPPLTLTTDKTDPDRSTWRNAEYIFSYYKDFINLTRVVGGKRELIYNACY